MRTLVDTNILLHAVHKRSPVHAAAQAALRDCVERGSGLLLTWPIVYEFLRVSTHPRVFSTPLIHEHAWAFVETLLGAPGCSLLVETPVHRAALADCAQRVPRLAGNLLHDFHTAVLMQEHGVRDILTLDRDFLAFPWVCMRGLGTPAT